MPKWSDELNKKIDRTNTESEKKPEKDGVRFSLSQIKDDLSKAKEGMKNSEICMNAMILGVDGTGKTGIMMDYVAKLPKEVLILDFDGGARAVFDAHHKDAKNVTIYNPLDAREEDGDIVVDYKQTISKIKGVLKIVKDNRNDYSAIVLDGISTLLKYCEYVMRIEKNIKPDGGVNLRYWINRSKMFTEILDFTKNIPSLDKFYVAHEDFMIKEDMASVKAKASQNMHQRIICERKKDVDKVTFVATIDKSKYNLKAEGKRYVFGTVEKDKVNWDTSKIFEGLK